MVHAQRISPYELGEQDIHRFREGTRGQQPEKADPFARYAEPAPATASVAWRTEGHARGRRGLEFPVKARP